MAVVAADPRIALVSRLTAAFGDEIERCDPRASIPWPNVPTVQLMVDHVGGIHRWVTEIVRTRGPVPDPAAFGDHTAITRAWFEEGRAALLDVLAATPEDEPCWIIGNRVGTVAFWRRRMIHENVKHLMDLRASGGGIWTVAPELTPDDYADGIDELVSVFLPRSRPNLVPLPGAVVLQTTDTDRSWRIDRDWGITSAADAGTDREPARIVARAGDLALALWERADPLDSTGRFQVEGSRATVAALRATSVHPW